MGLFERLPKVKKCCFCVKNLKIACFLIIFWVLISNMVMIAELWSPKCGNLYSHRSPVQILLNVMRIIYIVIEIAFFASIWVFVIGIFLKIPSAVGIFVYSLLLRSLISIIYFIFLFIHVHFTTCRWFKVALVETIAEPVFHIYFAVVVNSYRQDVMNPSRVEAS